MDTLVSNVYPMVQLATVDNNDSNDDLVCFERKPTDSRFLSNDFVAITPEEPLTPEIQSLTFVFPKSSLPRYTSINELFMSMCVSLEKQVTTSTTNATTGVITETVSDWGPVEDADNVAPCTFLHDVFWKQVEVYLGDTLVTASHSFRFVMSHLGRILGFHKTAFETFLSSELGVYFLFHFNFFLELR